MKTNQISDKLIHEIKREAGVDVSTDDIRNIMETYVSFGNKIYTKANNPALIYERYKHLAHESNEVMVIAVVNNQFDIIHDEIVYRGKTGQIDVDIKDVLKVPLINHGSNFVIVHNHPSGYSKLSDADINMAKNTIDKANILDLTMIDSITIAKDGFDSMRRNHSYVWNNSNNIPDELLKDDEILLTPSSANSNDKINELLDNTFKELKKIEMFKNALYTPFEEEGSYVLEIEAKDSSLEESKILLEFDINEQMSHKYLAKTIIEEVQLHYQLSGTLEQELEWKVQSIDSQVKQDIIDTISPLNQIAREKTGVNGFQFDFESIEYYCNYETGNIDIQNYLSDILKSYVEIGAEHNDSVDMLECICLYCDKVGMEPTLLLSYDDLHYHVIEDVMKELTGSENDFLNLSLDYNVDLMSERYRKDFDLYANKVMEGLYEDYLENININDVYQFDADTIVLNGDYKFIDKENTVCLKNLNSIQNKNIPTQQIQHHIEWLAEYYDEDYSEYINILKEATIKKIALGNEVGMVSTKEFIENKVEELREEGMISFEQYKEIVEDMSRFGNIDSYINDLTTDTRMVINDIFDNIGTEISDKYEKSQLKSYGIELNFDALVYSDTIMLYNSIDTVEASVMSLVNNPDNYYSYKNWQKLDNSSTLQDTYADNLNDSIPCEALNFNTEEFKNKLLEKYGSVEFKLDYLRTMPNDLMVEPFDLIGLSKDELIKVKDIVDANELKVSPVLKEDGILKSIFGDERENEQIVQEFFEKNYPNISKGEQDFIIDELPFLINDIMNDLQTSSSVKQLLTVIDSGKTEIELNDVYLLDVQEQNVLSEIASTKDITLKNSNEFTGTQFEETLGKLPQSNKKNNAKQSQMEMEM